jgi:hypothetical protein
LCCVFRALRNSVIFGRAIKNEYIAITTLASTGLLSYVATRGGKKEGRTASSGKSTLDHAKDSVPITAESRFGNVILIDEDGYADALGIGI